MEITNARVRVASLAAAMHLGLSLVVSAVIAAVVFGVWYHFPYRELLGGFQLFGLVVVVDVICGPFLTLLLYSPFKRRSTLVFDLSVVAMVQLAAMMYGLYTVAQVRPVALVFEVDRFVVVSAAQVVNSIEPSEPVKNGFSWFGPETLSVREPKDAQERIKSLELSLQGIEPSVRVDWWQPYENGLDLVKNRMKLLRELYQKQTKPDQEKISVSLKELNMLLDTTYYLPLVTQKSLDNCIVLLGADGVPRGFAMVNGFSD